jgi:hypothetical protein
MCMMPKPSKPNLLCIIVTVVKLTHDQDEKIDLPLEFIKIYCGIMKIEYISRLVPKELC